MFTFLQNVYKKYFQEQFALMPLIEGKMIKDILYTKTLFAKFQRKQKKNQKVQTQMMNL
jgi:hypothetical protein